MSENNNEELHWLAFQYVDGALSMDEREAFERRLADDQEAREAVASAVELGQTVSAAFARPTLAPAASEYRSSRRRVHWVAVLSAGGLLALLFAIGLGLNPSGAERAPLTQMASETDASEAELAMIWGELLHVEEPAPSADHEPLAALAEEDLDTQDWMVAALASMALEEASKE